MDCYLVEFGIFITKLFGNTNNLYLEKIRELLDNDQWLQATLAYRDGLAELYNIKTKKQFANFLYNFNLHGYSTENKRVELKQLNKISLFLADLAEYFERFEPESKKTNHLPVSKKKSTFNTNLLQRRLEEPDDIDTLPPRLDTMFTGTARRIFERFPKLFSEESEDVEEESDEDLTRLYNSHVDIFNSFVDITDNDFTGFLASIRSTIANADTGDISMHEVEQPSKSTLKVEATTKWPTGEGVIFRDGNMRLLYIQRSVLMKEKGSERLLEQLDKPVPKYISCKTPQDLSQAEGKYTLKPISSSKRKVTWLFASVKGHGLGRIQLTTHDQKRHFIKTPCCTRIRSLKDAVMNEQDDESEAEVQL